LTVFAEPAHRWAVACVAGVLTAGLVMAGCNNSGDSVDASHSSTPTTSSSSKPASAESYVGLAKHGAIAKANAAGQPWRIGREDGEQFMLSQDYVADRVTFEIDNGKVTKATLG
jgi:hypothetical protein